MTSVDELLWKPVSEDWIGLKEKDFFARYEDEVGDLDDAARSTRLLSDGTTVYELVTGYSVHVYKNKWSLYVSRQLAETQDIDRAWAAFRRGAWVKRVPREPGLYLVRDREGRMRVRELRIENGRLVDVSGGYVAAGKVSTFLGDWWSERLPVLPGSFV